MAAALRKQSAMDAVAELALNNGWDYCLTVNSRLGTPEGGPVISTFSRCASVAANRSRTFESSLSTRERRDAHAVHSTGPRHNSIFDSPRMICRPWAAEIKSAGPSTAALAATTPLVGSGEFVAGMQWNCAR